jgi:hypothetical protein
VLDLEPERLGQVRRAAHQAGADVAFDGGLARKAGHARSLSPACFRGPTGEGHALGVDAAGDVAVAGVMSGSVDLGDAVRTALPQNALFVVAIPAAR